MREEYVLGFAFRGDFREVLLILKDRPEWQAGFYNGIGGKIKVSEESPIQAMVREFEEEVGVFVPDVFWTPFYTMQDRQATWRVTVFWTDYHLCSQAKKMETEPPRWSYIDNLPSNIINNLNWLIPMAAATCPVAATVQEKMG